MDKSLLTVKHYCEFEIKIAFIVVNKYLDAGNAHMGGSLITRRLKQPERNLEGCITLYSLIQGSKAILALPNTQIQSELLNSHINHSNYIRAFSFIDYSL